MSTNYQTVKALLRRKLKTHRCYHRGMFEALFSSWYSSNYLVNYELSVNSFVLYLTTQKERSNDVQTSFNL